MAIDAERFGGIARLYGQDAPALLADAHVAVIGIGGVGSWIAEALIRTGIGQLTLFDLDDICVTNTNRQLHTLASTIGEDKATTVAERMMDINPQALVTPEQTFITPDNVAEHLHQGFDIVIDAIDSVTAKAAIIAHCRRHKIKIITIGGAGGQIDPRQITTGDLARTIQDPLLAKVRQKLRKDYGFSTNSKRKFAVDAVYSTEQLRYPQPDGSVCAQKKELTDGTRLDCNGGFGAVTMVTASFGMIAAARAVEVILHRARLTTA